MAINIYRGKDASATIWQGTAGSLIAILDACLINGYGAKTAAPGWAKVFTGTNKAVYQYTAESNRSFIRIDDDSSYANSFECHMYEGMTDVDTGTGRWPPNDADWRETWGPKTLKTTSGASNYEWIMVVNQGNFLLSWTTQNPDQLLGYGYRNYLMYYGKYKPWLADDTTYNEFIAVPQWDSSSDNHGGLGNDTQLTKFVRRGTNQVLGDNPIYLAGRYKAVYGGYRIGYHSSGYDYPTKENGILLSPITLRDTLNGTSLRGTLPGIWGPRHKVPLEHGDIFPATINGVTKTFLAVDAGTTSTAHTSRGRVLVEISDTWEF